jgi:hypothetical protein
MTAAGQMFYHLLAAGIAINSCNAKAWWQALQVTHDKLSQSCTMTFQVTHDMQQSLTKA